MTPEEDPWFAVHMQVYEAVRGGVLKTPAAVRNFTAALCEGMRLPLPAPPESQERINQHIETCPFPPLPAGLLTDQLWLPGRP